MLSFVYAVPLRTSAGSFNPFLELYLYRNRLQLATHDACYSDGDRYTPAVMAVNHLGKSISAIKQVLALGTGLGSIVNVFAAKKTYPRFTLVEIDKLVLGWAMEVLAESKAPIVPVCSDAMIFMERNQAEYDLVFVDIFSGRVVPDFVTSIPFLQQCRAALVEGGRVVLNYIINDEKQWDNISRQFTEVFPRHKVLSNGINRILITDAHEKSRS